MIALRIKHYPGNTGAPEHQSTISFFRKREEILELNYYIIYNILILYII